MAFMLKEIEPAQPVVRGVWSQASSQTVSPAEARPYVGMIGVRVYATPDEFFDPPDDALREMLLASRWHMPYADVSNDYNKTILVVLAPGEACSAAALATLEDQKTNAWNPPAERCGWAGKSIGKILRSDAESVLIVLSSADGQTWLRRVYRLAD